MGTSGQAAEEDAARVCKYSGTLRANSAGPDVRPRLCLIPRLPPLPPLPPLPLALLLRPAL